MSEIDDGEVRLIGDYLYPPRFETAPGGGVVKLTGITRRDWLAGLAMQGLLASPREPHGSGDILTAENYSDKAYGMADAMIVEGRK